MALKKIGSNRYRVTVSVRDKTKGYPISKQVTVTGNLAAAKLTESDLIRELKARTLTSAYASTFGEAVDLYVGQLRERGRLSVTHKAAIGYVQRELGHIRLELFTERFEAYRKYLMTTPTARGILRKGSTINRIVNIVRAVFNHLVNLELIDRNPISKVRFPKLEEHSRDRLLTPEERLKLFSAIRDCRPHILPIVQYMIQVPCRVSELVTAAREQYNPFTQTIYIPDSKAGIPIHKPIPPDMAEYFRSIPADSPYLFYRKSANGYRPLTGLPRAWAACLSHAGIADYHIHDLRHEAVTRLYELGNSERAIADVAGWTRPNMLDVYRHRDCQRSAQRMVFDVKLPEASPVSVAVAM